MSIPPIIPSLSSPRPPPQKKVGGNDEEGVANRSALPLIAGAIVLAQLTMAASTALGGRLTDLGYGRRPLFLAALLSLPVRCYAIVRWRDAGSGWLLSTQVLDGIGGGLFGIMHPYIVADITFGTGRFNVLSEFRDAGGGGGLVWVNMI